MLSPGVKDLGDFAITAAGTAVGTPITGLDGILAATVQLRLAYGSGGTNVRAYLQTSADQGSTWIDLACVLFGTASEVAVLNFSGLTPKTRSPRMPSMAVSSANEPSVGTTAVGPMPAPPFCRLGWSRDDAGGVHR